jgi:hypothetical protein
MLTEDPEEEEPSGLLVNIWPNSVTSQKPIILFSLQVHIANHYNQFILFDVTYDVVDIASLDGISVAEC